MTYEDSFLEGYYDSLLEGLISDIRVRRELRNADREALQAELKLKREYLRYQRSGGRLSIKNFKNKELRQFEIDHRRNPKKYPTLSVWRRLKKQEREEKLRIAERESIVRRRNAKSEHDESIARVNRAKARKRFE